MGSCDQLCALIIWIDSGAADGWCDRDDPPEPVEIRSVGFVLAMTDEHVTITSCLSGAEAHAPMSIPRSAIQGMTTFYVAEFAPDVVEKFREQMREDSQ